MTMREARVEAQAKVNLFLRVLCREASGYHQIETLFCRVSLADSVRVSVGGTSKHLDIAGPHVPPSGLGSVEKNLAWKAASAYAAATGFPSGFEIVIEKRIPVGGGLGGGSADAGGVLRALNALNPRPLDRAALLQMAPALGADVPFLTQDVSPLALGWGRGERLALLPALPISAVWLLVPSASVNTAEAYRWLDQAGVVAQAEAFPISDLGNWGGVAARARNDFEPAVAARVPIIGRLLENLRSPDMMAVLGPEAIVFMSGSGSSVAVVCGQPPGAALLAPPRIPGVDMIETETAAFVEPVVLTH
jgi:4-diphosphocytidyl-2-C-methyl-D-erythritol kinase